MRVSTSQFYFQSAQLMNQKSADVNNQMEHLSSGKRVLTAKDDAVSYSTLAGFNDDLANIEKYKRNITMAENNNSMQEVIFSDAQTLLDKVKQDMLLANNGRMSVEDLQAMADQMRNDLDNSLILETLKIRRVITFLRVIKHKKNLLVNKLTALLFIMEIQV